MDDIRCSVCLQFKHPDEFYKFKNPDRRCKQCKIYTNCKRLLCECGRYFTKTHYQRHLQSNLHKKGIGVY